MWWLWLAIIVLTVPSVEAAPQSTAPWGRIDDLATGRDVAAPAGWLNYCLAELERCVPATAVTELNATSELLALVQQVQANANRRIAARPEPAGRDLWQIAVTSGDCEDFALAKQAALRRAGLPAGAVRLATARLASGEFHAVLTVATSDGTLVLDNLLPSAVPLRTLNYAWLRLQGVRGSLRWEELSGGGQPGSATGSLPTVP